MAAKVDTNIKLYYGQGKTPVGQILVVCSDTGLRAIRLLEEESLDNELHDLIETWPDCEFVEDEKSTKPYVTQIKKVLSGKARPDGVQLDLHGTPFQLRVWRKLLEIPPGETWTYTDVAAKVGKPSAVRAVANACAANPIALVVPCHRVIRSDGSLGGYFYGLQRKQSILDHEKNQH